MQAALYGNRGFFVREAATPARHFRTSVHASPELAGAVLALADEIGAGCVVDVGAGGGELLRVLDALRPGLRLVGVELAPRPTGLPASVEWRRNVPDGLDALIVANEWLDNVPLDVVEADDAGDWRLLLVDVETGDERHGPGPSPADAAWLERWWPRPRGIRRARAEIGRTRDAAWAGAVGALSTGVAVAMDYAHRRQARPPHGTLAAYRCGRSVRPVPDGSCDLTAHVALDACAAATDAPALLLPQRDAQRARGGRAARPASDRARTAPVHALPALGRSSATAEILDPEGLGGFTWLVQAVGCDLPRSLVAAASDALARRAVIDIDAGQRDRGDGPAEDRG